MYKKLVLDKRITMQYVYFSSLIFCCYCWLVTILIFANYDLLFLQYPTLCCRHCHHLMVKLLYNNTQAQRINRWCLYSLISVQKEIIICCLIIIIDKLITTVIYLRCIINTKKDDITVDHYWYSKMSSRSPITNDTCQC